MPRWKFSIFSHLFNFVCDERDRQKPFSVGSKPVTLIDTRNILLAVPSLFVGKGDVCFPLSENQA